MKKILYIYLFASLLLAACSSEDVPSAPSNPNQDKQIELRLDVKDFVGETKTRFTADPTEYDINDLYLFIETSTHWYSYYIAGPTFSGGVWDENNNEIRLALTPGTAGTADVYVVANAGPGTLSGVNSAAVLKAYALDEVKPWSAHIDVPLIMSGKKMAHDFNSTPVLNAVQLTRAVAKVEIEVELSLQHQEFPTITNPYDATDVRDQYKYELLNFDKNTYLFEQSSKTDDLAHQTWTAWAPNYDDALSAYDLSGGKVTTLKFTTYLNERDSGAATTINVALPLADTGTPPPQFEDEWLPIELPVTLKRNHYYKVKVQM